MKNIIWGRGMHSLREQPVVWRPWSYATRSLLTATVRHAAVLPCGASGVWSLSLPLRVTSTGAVSRILDV